MKPVNQIVVLFCLLFLSASGISAVPLPASVAPPLAGCPQPSDSLVRAKAERAASFWKSGVTLSVGQSAAVDSLSVRYIRSKDSLNASSMDFEAKAQARRRLHDSYVESVESCLTSGQLEQLSRLRSLKSSGDRKKKGAAL